MGWSNSNEERRADHYRDHAKQEPRIGDRLRNNGLELLSVVEGVIAALAADQQFPLTVDILRNAAARYRRDNGMEV